MAILLCQTRSIANYFASQDPILNATLVETLPLAILCCNGCGVLPGTLTGLGKQKKMAPIFLLCQYILSLPIGLYCGLTTEVGVKAFFIAQMSSTLALTFGFLNIALKEDWD